MTNTILKQLKAEEIKFNDVIEFINSKFNHQPTAFNNGLQFNAADQNQGSAKVFGFGKIENLSKEDTLLLFAEHYKSVLDNPQGDDHQNIRQFMLNGWDGISFDGEPLILK